MEATLIRIAAAVAALSTIIGAYVKVKKWLRAKKLKREEFEKNLFKSIDGLRTDVRVLGTDVTTMMRNQLMSAHSQYMRIGWIPAEEKRSLLDTYDMYSKRGLNSLAASYKQDISELDEYPPGNESCPWPGPRPPM